MIFNSAVSARKGVSNWSVYTATKGALLSMARALAVELAPRRIQVNTVIPGPIDTPAVGELGLPPDQADLSANTLPFPLAMRNEYSPTTSPERQVVRYVAEGVEDGKYWVMQAKGWRRWVHRLSLTLVT